MLRRHTGAVLLTTLALFTAAPLSGQVSAPPTPLKFVPWKLLKPDEPPAKADLILYWLPATSDEIRRSPFITSRVLSSYAATCVAMHLVRPDDHVTAAKLGAGGSVSEVVLTDVDGAVLGRLTSEGGSLSVHAAEKMVREIYSERESETDRLLDEAKELVAQGDTAGAGKRYREVVARRCSFPRKAREAERALHKLGLTTVAKR